MSKPVIAVDVDEVLLPHFQDLINWYNREYETTLTLAHNHPTDPRPWGVDSKSEAVTRVRRFFETQEFENGLPFQEAVEAVQLLSKAHEMVVVTARDNLIEEATRNWLGRHFRGLFSEAHFTAKFSLEGNARSKADVCVAIGAEYLVDDSLAETFEAAEVGVKGLLFGNYPWNQADSLPDGVVRVRDWDEVIQVLAK